MPVIRHFINANGSHLTANFGTQERADAYVLPDGAFETPLRPSELHEWIDGAWVEQPAPVIDLDAIDTATLNAKLLEPGSVDRAELKTLFNHENRMRVLEGKAAITQAQFVTALKATMR